MRHEAPRAPGDPVLYAKLTRWSKLPCSEVRGNLGLSTLNAKKVKIIEADVPRTTWYVLCYMVTKWGLMSHRPPDLGLCCVTQ